MAPAEPRTNAGNTKDQYLPGLSANARRIVATIKMLSAKRIIHLELMTRDSDPVKLIANASTPIGIMCSAVEMADHP